VDSDLSSLVSDIDKALEVVEAPWEPDKRPLEWWVRLPEMRRCRRTVPFRGAPGCSALPRLSQRRKPDGRGCHRAQSPRGLPVVPGGYGNRAQLQIDVAALEAR
jgi:hypothetical protein